MANGTVCLVRSDGHSCMLSAYMYVMLYVYVCMYILALASRMRMYVLNVKSSNGKAFAHDIHHITQCSVVTRGKSVRYSSSCSLRRRTEQFRKDSGETE